MIRSRSSDVTPPSRRVGSGEGLAGVVGHLPAADGDSLEDVVLGEVALDETVVVSVDGYQGIPAPTARNGRFIRSKRPRKSRLATERRTARRFAVMDGE